MEKLFYTMGEVAEMFDVNQSLIRHWEGQFSELKPKRNKKGNRLFTRQDVEYLKQIYHLVKELGMTLEGARKILKTHREDGAVAQDVELMEHLQRIRSLLAEVREELKLCGGEVSMEECVSNSAGEEVHEVWHEEQEEATSVEADECAVKEPTEPKSAQLMADEGQYVTRRRRTDGGEDEAQDKELFAFYEQSLF